jgi:hypothetical protein
MMSEGPVRALTVLVVVMGVLIVAATVGLAVAIVQRLGGAPGVATEASLGQPAGSRIGGIAAAEGRIAVHVLRPDGERILLIEPRSGRIAADLRLSD